MALPWPVFTIDFEASSPDRGTYPIEVGICRWTSPNSPIQGWSSLIRPLPEWDAHGSWSRASEDIHGISRAELDAGMTPVETMTKLNALLGDGTAFCDSSGHDAHWARMLARGANIGPTFTIGNFGDLAAYLDQFGYMRFLRWRERTPARHRARDDAERLMKALARGLRLEHGTSTMIAP